MPPGPSFPSLLLSAICPPHVWLLPTDTAHTHAHAFMEFPHCWLDWPPAFSPEYRSELIFICFAPLMRVFFDHLQPTEEERGPCNRGNVVERLKSNGILPIVELSHWNSFPSSPHGVSALTDQFGQAWSTSSSPPLISLACFLPLKEAVTKLTVFALSGASLWSTQRLQP